MFFTYTGPHRYTFEIVSVERQLTPIRSLITVEVKVFDKKLQKEVARARLGQIPLTEDLYEKDTVWYPECPRKAEAYAQDLSLAMQTFGSLLAPTDDLDYDLRVR